MVTRSNSAFTLNLAIVTLLMTASAGFAEYHELDSPFVARPQDYPEADYEKIIAVLERKDCKFLGGAALNAHTSLRYGGKTIPLNLFIEALAGCPNATVHVSFFRPATGAPECDWLVTHHLTPKMDFVVRINMESKNINLEDLYLPPVKAEKPTANETAPTSNGQTKAPSSSGRGPG